MSKISAIWFVSSTSTSMGCELWRLSRLAPPTLHLETNSSQASQSGWKRSTTIELTNVAKASLSQRYVHHPIVTRLPNHWCTISCAMTLAEYRFIKTEAEGGTMTPCSR